jgi:hypothetical protein
MSSFVYQGYDMSNLCKYCINCKDCPQKVNVYKANVSDNPKPLAKNVGRYYYSCDKTNSNGCKFFRWFEHKWPKVKHEYPDNEVVNETDYENTVIDIKDLVAQVDSMEISLLTTQQKNWLRNNIQNLIDKINSESTISYSKKQNYLQYLTNLKDNV